MSERSQVAGINNARVKSTDERASLAAGVETLYAVRETCAILSIGPTKCWELINQGALEVVRLGARCTRVKKSSIDRLTQTGVSVKEAQ